MTKIVDLRSDTVTRPGAEMRQAMATAEVGDDVFGDDPTVKRLEERVASLLGKEAALFVASGTMGNHVALACITQPGDEVILDRQSHIFNNEVAAAAALCGLQLNPLDGDFGVITARQIEPHIRPTNLHQPRTRAIAIENTHNRCGGRVFPLDDMKQIRELARANDMRVHLDGSRLANAVVASGISFDAYAACADTVNMCFSKGLGAPVGSIVAGDLETIERARRKRKQFGGGMRQVGILAAAALYALDHHIDRLEVDHANARQLGAAIDSIDGLERVYPIETNFVIVRVGEPFGDVKTFLGNLREHRILANPFGRDLVRLVLHLDVDASDVDYVAGVLSGLAGRPA